MINHLPECHQSEGKWDGGCIDAVAALPVESRGIGMKDDALAAIDALRGDP